MWVVQISCAANATRSLTAVASSSARLPDALHLDLRQTGGWQSQISILAYAYETVFSSKDSRLGMWHIAALLFVANAGVGHNSRIPHVR